MSVDLSSSGESSASDPESEVETPPPAQRELSTTTEEDDEDNDVDVEARDTLKFINASTDSSILLVALIIFYLLATISSVLLAYAIGTPVTTAPVSDRIKINGLTSSAEVDCTCQMDDDSEDMNCPIVCWRLYEYFWTATVELTSQYAWYYIGAGMMCLFIWIATLVDLELFEWAQSTYLRFPYPQYRRTFGFVNLAPTCIHSGLCLFLAIFLVIQNPLLGGLFAGQILLFGLFLGFIIAAQMKIRATVQEERINMRWEPKCRMMLAFARTGLRDGLVLASGAAFYVAYFFILESESLLSVSNCLMGGVSFVLIAIWMAILAWSFVYEGKELARRRAQQQVRPPTTNEKPKKPIHYDADVDSLFEDVDQMMGVSPLFYSQLWIIGLTAFPLACAHPIVMGLLYLQQEFWFTYVDIPLLCIDKWWADREKKEEQEKILRECKITQ